ncbi:MAG: hypothetical protein J6B89_03440 [Bacilli bacterium]|nr:hypothetical protein [Bacilli bacterium]
MKARVKMRPASVIKTRLGIQRGGPAHAFFTQSCYDHMTKFVPGGTKSHLNREVDLQVDKIIYQSPGARYLYHGKLMVDPITGKGAFYNESYGYWSRPAKYGIKKILTNRDLIYRTPGTGSYWDKLMWTSQKDEIIKEVQEYVNRGCKK